MQEKKTLIFDGRKINQKVNRIAWQIYENFHKEKEIILAGIVGNGEILSEKIAKTLREISPLKIHVAKVTLNKRDPLSHKIETNIADEDLNDKIVIIVDDVLDSGRTLIYGVQYFLKFKVKQLKTVVLIDRSHRLFPVRADFVGTTLATTLQEHIRVELDVLGNEAAYLI